MVISSQEFMEVEVWEEEVWDPFEDSVEGDLLSPPRGSRGEWKE